MVKKDYDVIIVGSGPAGLTASIYAIRSNLKTLVIAGTTPGGQLMLTTDVEDYPGFPGGIQGPELMQKMREQAALLKVDFLDENVTKVDVKSEVKKVYVEKDEYKCKALIIATGASAKWLGIKSEQRLIGRGVSACATCDGYFFKDKDVTVIGGGDTALREVLFLAKICKNVTVIHRRDQLRAQKVLQDRAFTAKNIDFIWNSEVEEFLGKEKLDAVKIKDVKTGKTSEIKCEGSFVAIGHTPNTKFLEGTGIKLHGPGYIEVRDTVKTNVEGVFASGDVHDYRYMQAVTAASAGCMAAMEADTYIENLKHKE
ncbi:MAG TPA: thioredoxin-disulfide reductase [Candidatus Nanoarchaeia archaeon]|nr:thioredoxin-disulfide reductase [Candidatus Nanoarchaeia archaeon]